MENGSWHLIVTNKDIYDPTDVVYQLVKIENNKIVERDGFLHSFDCGFMKRLKQALKNKVFTVNYITIEELIEND